jgi:hypothetical protein
LITHGLNDKVGCLDPRHCEPFLFHIGFHVVVPSCAERTAASLEKICADDGSVLLKMYDVAHAVTEKELQDIVEFILDKTLSD